ncbi:metaxin 1, partial [Coemansia sp. RSA 2607]
ASPDGRLPFLLLPQRTALDAAAIEQHVQGGLPQSPPDHRAFLALAEHNLLPAVDYLAWVDTEGAGILLPRLLPFHPLVQWALGVQRASHMASVLRTSQPEYAATLDAHVIYDNALRALDALVVLLDDKTYFAGERPAALDALVFACVNAIVELPVPSPLRAALLREDSKYAPLVAFTMRILERYFPSTEKSDLI